MLVVSYTCIWFVLMACYSCKLHPAGHYSHRGSFHNITAFTRSPSSQVEPARRVRLAFFSLCKCNFLSPRGGSDEPPFLLHQNSRIQPASWGRHDNFMYKQKAESALAIGGSSGRSRRACILRLMSRGHVYTFYVKSQSELRGDEHNILCTLYYIHCMRFVACLCSS